MVCKASSAEVSRKDTAANERMMAIRGSSAWVVRWCIKAYPVLIIIYSPRLNPLVSWMCTSVPPFEGNDAFIIICSNSMRTSEGEKNVLISKPTWWQWLLWWIICMQVGTCTFQFAVVQWMQWPTTWTPLQHDQRNQATALAAISISSSHSCRERIKLNVRIILVATQLPGASFRRIMTN